MTKPETSLEQYVPYQALLGGEGIAQPGQSEPLGSTENGFIRRATLLNMSCPDMYAAMITVMLQAVRTDPAPPEEHNEVLPAFARVQFGVGGTQQQADVDFVNGACFSVPAAFLRVEAILEPEVPSDPPFAIQARALVGYYPNTRTRSAQRTLFTGVLAPAASAVLPVPAFADRLEVLPTTAGATMTVEQFSDLAATVAVGAVAVPAQGPVLQIPLTNLTRYVRITNTSAAAISARALFQLAL